MDENTAIICTTGSRFGIVYVLERQLHNYMWEAEDIAEIMIDLEEKGYSFQYTDFDLSGVFHDGAGLRPLEPEERETLDAALQEISISKAFPGLFPDEYQAMKSYEECDGIMGVIYVDDATLAEDPSEYIDEIAPDEMLCYNLECGEELLASRIRLYQFAKVLTHFSSVMELRLASDDEASLDWEIGRALNQKEVSYLVEEGVPISTD